VVDAQVCAACGGRHEESNMTQVTILASVALAAALSVSALATTAALAGPKANAHANAHASSNSHVGGNGGGTSNGNGGGSVVHAAALASGMSQGELSSSLKSWNSLNANPHAFLNALDNPNSLHGKQAAYICNNATSVAALADFEALGGDPAIPPRETEFNDANSYLDAVTLLGGVAPTDVLADPLSTPEMIDAANLVLASTLTPESAETLIDQYNAYLAYGTAEAAAEDSFLVASVSSKGATAEELEAVRTNVDTVVMEKGMDMTTLCPAEAPAP
jgi:hypothetical protein